MRAPTRGSTDRGFTLIELLVVISIIIVLIGLMSTAIPMVIARSRRLECAKHLSEIGKACVAYSSDYSSRYPWTKRGGQGQLAEDKDARECLELLYKLNLLDDPAVFVCPGAKGWDEAAEKIDGLTERRETFSLEDNQCSYTWRNAMTTEASDSNTPISGDKRGGEVEPTNHKDGRNVLFSKGKVEWYTIENLQSDSKDARKFKKELIGFGNLE